MSEPSVPVSRYIAVHKAFGEGDEGPRIIFDSVGELRRFWPEADYDVYELGALIAEAVQETRLTKADAPPNPLHEKDCRWFPEGNNDRLPIMAERLFPYWVCSPACTPQVEGQKEDDGE